MSEKNSSNILRDVLVGLIVAALAGGTVPLWWRYAKDLCFKINSSSHRKVLRSGTLKVGEQWNESNSRAYIKFEKYSNPDITVNTELDWEGTDHRTVYYTSKETIEFSSPSNSYKLELGGYNPDSGTISVRVIQTN